MNLFKQLLQKGGLVAGAVGLWLLDDLLVFLPDEAVWSMTEYVLKLFGRADRKRYLKAYWIGILDDE